MSTKNEISSRFIEAYEQLLSNKNITDKKDFATKIGISPSMVTEISKGRSAVGTTAIQNIVLVFNISANWLLTGQGEMFTEAKTKDIEVNREAIPIMEGMPSGIKPIPLVTEHAAAGFGNECFTIHESDVKDYYVIPKFRFNHVDFMIEVSGLSMYPHFKSGDVIACTILHEAKYIQWNRCHVIATREQGILVKRIMPSENEECFKIVSDNKDFPPFDLPKEEITGIALVVGCVSLE
ncbi:MAG: helix-turn-helix transcriptional regulator [Escherichia coli]|nr:helix-turn-helix transcriptional regulator [Escherichia coli]